jgi:hypothetical protein
MVCLTASRAVLTTKAVASSPAPRSHMRAAPCVAHALSAGRAASFGNGALAAKVRICDPTVARAAASRLGIRTTAPLSVSPGARSLIGWAPGYHSSARWVLHRVAARPLA